MDRYNHITLLRGKNLPFQKGAEHGNRHDNILEFINRPVETHKDFQELWKDLHHNHPYVCAQNMPMASSIPNQSMRPRKQVVLGVKDTECRWAFVDIDSYDKKTFVPKGHKEASGNIELPHTDFESCVINILDNYTDLKGVAMDIKASSSYYRKGHIKFHATIELSNPATHKQFSAYVKHNLADIADTNFNSTAGQLIYTSIPQDPDVHTDFTGFFIEGGKLTLPDVEYMATPIIKGNVTKVDDSGIQYRKIPDKRFEDKLAALDMNDNCNSQLYWTFRESIANCYDRSVTASMEVAAHAREGKGSKVETQYQAALKDTNKLCFEPFFDVEQRLLEYDEWVDYTKLVPNDCVGVPLPEILNGVSDLPSYNSVLQDFEPDKDISITVNIIKGSTGCGKTEGMRLLLKPNETILISTPNKSLVGFNSNAFGGAVKVQEGSEKGADLVQYDNVATTIHSLFKCTERMHDRRFKYFFLDEAHQEIQLLPFLPHAEEVIKALRLGLCSSDFIVMTDEGASTNTIEMMQKLLNIKIKVGSAQNLIKKRKQECKAHCWSNGPALVDEFQKAVKAGRKCLFVGDSIALIQKKLPDVIGRSKGFRFFTGEHKDTEEYKEFIDDPVKFTNKYGIRVICCTSVIQSGVSWEGYFDEVFVHYNASNKTGNHMLQMLGRERHPKTLHYVTCNFKMPQKLAKEGADNLDQCKAMVHEEERLALSVRKRQIALKLNQVGIPTFFHDVKRSKVSFKSSSYMEYVPSANQQERSVYLSFICRVICKLDHSTIKNKLSGYESLDEEALNLYFKGERIGFFKCIKDLNLDKKGAWPTTIKALEKKLNSWCLDDKGVYKNLVDEGITYAKSQRGKVTRTNEILKGAELPDNKPYYELKDTLDRIYKLMPLLDEFYEIYTASPTIEQIQELYEAHKTK